MKKNYKIVVVGLGYVGLSNAVLLAQHNEVIGVDISQDRVDALNARTSPIIDEELSQYLAEKDLNLSASTDLKSSIGGADYVIVSTPTNYDEQTNFFDTSDMYGDGRSEKYLSKIINYFIDQYKFSSYTPAHMANTKSAIKRIRRISKQTAVNKARKSRYKNALKKMNLLIETKKKSEALKFLPKLNSELMKIAKSGIIKKQNASRNVSRLTKKIAAL